MKLLRAIWTLLGAVLLLFAFVIAWPMSFVYEWFNKRKPAHCRGCGAMNFICVKEGEPLLCGECGRPE